MTDPAALWAYLSEAPLLWLTATLLAYILADFISRQLNRHPLANPVLLSVAILAGVLALTATPYESYFEGAQFVHFLLGPATVALAVPLQANLRRVGAVVVPLIGALLVGSLTAMGSVVLLARLADLDLPVLLSLVPKSATAPVAMGVSEQIGGSPALTAVLVILTGMIGAVIVTPLFNAMGLRDYRARGFALGVAAHGIGTARAFQVSQTAGVFSGLGMGLNAVLTSLLAPLMLLLL